MIMEGIHDLDLVLNGVPRLLRSASQIFRSQRLTYIGGGGGHWPRG